MPYEQYRMEGLEHRVTKLEKDVIHGNGLPGLTTRMAIQEERMDKTDKNVKSIDNKFWAIVLMLITVMAGLAVDIGLKR